VRRIFAKAPDGTLISRGTRHTYTHVIAYPREDHIGGPRFTGSATWLVWGWTKHPTRMLSRAKAIYRRAVAIPVSA
jgi:hypothetical protein